jgi:TctA family transporter
MLNALVQGLGSLLTVEVGSYLMIGVLVGLVVGILPGLGSPGALALMLPFTFGLEPVSAFAMMLSMLAVTSITGDITSILIGVPGEPSSAALVVDGYPMTKQGQAGRALGASLAANLVGAIFGAAVLAAVIPVVRPIVLSLRSGELFALTVLGLSFLGALSRGRTLKGLAAGAIGMLIATIGLDPQTGIGRFTFGQLGLWDGVAIVSVAMGLFAIPELLDLSLRGTAIAERAPGRLGGLRTGARDVSRHLGLTLRCSALGAIVGMLPGMGGSVGQWIAYGHAVQSTPDKSRFGKGAIEGVIGPGAANNSKEGGSLIPTVLFGIPGGTTMAILLGGMLIQGLVPGPSMLQEQLPLTMSFVWVIVIANIIGVAICTPLIGQLARLTTVRASIVIPIITFFVYLGAYAQSRLTLDIWLTLIFGGIGVAMVALDWPRPPLMLGIVLGELAERYLFRAVAGDGYNWMLRPSVLVILLLTLVVIFSGVRGDVVERRRTVRGAGEHETESAEARDGD